MTEKNAQIGHVLFDTFNVILLCVKHRSTSLSIGDDLFIAASTYIKTCLSITIVNYDTMASARCKV